MTIEDALGRAKWITSANWLASPGDGLPVIATGFEVESGAGGQIAIAAAGVYRMSVNGRVIGPHVLEPGYSNYAIKIEYTVYDISDLLVPGVNTVAVEVGPGMYKSHPVEGRWVKITTEFGDLGIRAALSIDNPSGQSLVLTDELWRATQGPTLLSNWTGGEDFDAHHEVDLDAAAIGTWPAAQIAAVSRTARLIARTSTPLSVVEEFGAVAVTEPTPKIYVVDFGVNFAGWAEIRIPPHSSVRLRPAELLHSDGTVNAITEGWAPVFHTVVSDEQSLTWHPRFMYNGLRYLEVSGLDAPPELGGLRAMVIAADVTTTGSFSSSNELINQIYRITRRAITSNMFSVFTDCPHREKLGYLEQLHLVFEILVRNYDVRPILEHTVDLTTESLRPDGSIGLYVPEWEVFDEPWRGDVNFGGAIGFLPWQLYRCFGDDAVLHRCFPALRRYVAFLQKSLVDGLLVDGIGDWDGREFRTVPVVASATFHGLLQVASQIAEVIGEQEQAAAWRGDADRLRTVFGRRFSSQGGYGEGSLAEVLLSLRHGLVPDERVGELVDQCEREIIATDYYVDVGEIGMSALVHVLSRHDRHDTLFRLTQGTERPGYGYMVAHGATSLTETWDGPTYGYSQNHFMNGAIVTWFHEHILGITQTRDSVGFSELWLRPRPCGDISWAKGHYDSVSGRITIRWSLERDQFIVSGSVPENIAATINLPSGFTTRLGAGPFSFCEEVRTLSSKR